MLTIYRHHVHDGPHGSGATTPMIGIKLYFANQASGTQDVVLNGRLDCLGEMGE